MVASRKGKGKRRKECPRLALEPRKKEKKVRAVRGEERRKEWETIALA